MTCNLPDRISFLTDVNVDEEAAFSRFVGEHGDRLLRHARLLIPDDGEAEDALQTALLRLIPHWSRQLESPETYVRRTLANLAIDRGRRRHLVAKPALVTDSIAAKHPDHAEALAARAELDAVLGALPPRQRAAVVLRVIDGLSEAETAAAMGTSVGTAKSNLARGLQKVRELLRAESSCMEGTQP